MPIKNIGLFLDRDGVIVEDVHLLDSKEKVKLIPGITDLIKYCNTIGLKVFVITNQPVVARGILSIQEMIDLNNYIISLLIDQNLVIDDVAICPHHPNATIKEYRSDCSCRKPRPGMLFSIAKKHNIDLKKSFLIGDRISDIAAGRQAGCMSILIQTGKHNEPLIQTNAPIDPAYFIPDHTIIKFEEAIRIIEGNTND